MDGSIVIDILLFFHPFDDALSARNGLTGEGFLAHKNTCAATLWVGGGGHVKVAVRWSH